MSNIFRPVSDNTILPDRIYKGQSWRNISFGTNATIEEYAQHGLYVETGTKPAYTSIQNISDVIETINHTTKQIELTWTVTDKPQIEIDVILDRELKDTEREDERLNNVMTDLTFEQAEIWLDNNVTDLPSAIEALKKMVRLILART